MLNRLLIPPEKVPTRPSFRCHNRTLFNRSSAMTMVLSFDTPQIAAYKKICSQHRAVRLVIHVPLASSHQKEYRVEDTIQFDLESCDRED